ncbi:hypothetical protein AOQ84DRAFT_354549 [Glonium stellatum]|uniref:Pyruvate carboxyltransferase domain-containing protein n=1 Tax=Glonium stellatum TaxID=574774 RepID=A0A8E2F1B4_9PEZI|nr:hypothetical protein AOQ84DRAFT_354549 [Glonium stellatum]
MAGIFLDITDLRLSLRVGRLSPVRILAVILHPLSGNPAYSASTVQLHFHNR